MVGSFPKPTHSERFSVLGYPFTYKLRNYHLKLLSETIFSQDNKLSNYLKFTFAEKPFDSLRIWFSFRSCDHVVIELRWLDADIDFHVSDCHTKIWVLDKKMLQCGLTWIRISRSWIRGIIFELYIYMHLFNCTLIKLC